MTPASPGSRPPLGADGSATGGALRLVGWVLALVAGVLVLHGVGGALAPPPLGEPGQLGRWLDQREPAEAAMAVVRLVALGMAWYLLAVTVAGTVARLAGVRTLVRAVDIVTAPAVRRVVTGALGVSMAAAMFAGTGGAAVADERSGVSAASTPASTPASSPETMRRLPDAEADGSAPSPTVAAPVEMPLQQPSATGPPPTMRRLPAAAAEDDPPFAPPSSTPPTSAPAGAASTATTSTAPPPSAGAPPPARQGPAPGNRSPAPGTASATSAERTWRVQPGDHFWSVAERVLGEAWHHSPTDAEVDPYWRSLVDANRSVLRDAANPDLVFPGQVITVPAPPPTPSQGR